jgi:hypothetical protein
MATATSHAGCGISTNTTKPPLYEFSMAPIFVGHANPKRRLFREMAIRTSPVPVTPNNKFADLEAVIAEMHLFSLLGGTIMTELFETTDHPRKSGYDVSMYDWASQPA